MTHQVKDLVDLDILDADVAIIGQKAQTTNLFDFSMQPKPQSASISSGY